MNKPKKILTVPFTNIHSDVVLNLVIKRRLCSEGGEDYSTFAPVAQFANSVPEKMRLAGGFIIPVYDTESIILELKSPSGYPFAVKASKDENCLLTGRLKTHGLSQGQCRTENGVRDFQNYLCTSLNTRLDRGYTGKGSFDYLHGHYPPLTIELEIYPFKSDRWPPAQDVQSLKPINVDGYDLPVLVDTRKASDYDQNTLSRIRLHLVTMDQWEAITGKPSEYPPLTK